MKFIQPSVEYWPQEVGIEGVWKQIARATRVSYQSKQKECENDLDFVKRVIFRPALIEGDLDDLEHCKFDNNKGHFSVLEHGTIYLAMPMDSIIPISANPWTKYHNNKYSKGGIVCEVNGEKRIAYTSNLRVLVEKGWLEDLQYLCEPTEYHHRRYTFNVITDIGVTREGNRHRKNSLEEQDFSTVEESTRYNSYDKGKYNGELKYILPTWVEESSPMKAFEGLNKEQQLQVFKDWCSDISKGETGNWDALSYYMFALKAAEFAYMGIRHNDNDTWTAEKARQVLNLNTKTNVVWTAYAEDWKHFLALRSSQAVSGTPHPNIRIIADKIAEIAKEQKLW